MPISKTCYFCKPVGKKECDACTNVTKSNFVGNADWLYIEQLEKENEELKKENSRWKMIPKEIGDKWENAFSEIGEINFGHFLNIDEELETYKKDDAIDEWIEEIDNDTNRLQLALYNLIDIWEYLKQHRESL